MRRSTAIERDFGTAAIAQAGERAHEKVTLCGGNTEQAAFRLAAKANTQKDSCIAMQAPEFWEG